MDDLSNIRRRCLADGSSRHRAIIRSGCLRHFFMPWATQRNHVANLFEPPRMNEKHVHREHPRTPFTVWNSSGFLP